MAFTITASSAHAAIKPRALPAGVVCKVGVFDTTTKTFTAAAVDTIYMMKIPNRSVILDMYETHSTSGATSYVAMGIVGALSHFSVLAAGTKVQLNRASKNLPYLVSITDTAADQFLYLTAAYKGKTTYTGVTVKMVVTYIDASSLNNA